MDRESTEKSIAKKSHIQPLASFPDSVQTKLGNITNTYCKICSGSKECMVL